MFNFNQTALCLICSHSVNVIKKFNCRRYYETKRAEIFENLKGSARNDKITLFKKSVETQQHFFVCIPEDNKCCVRERCIVAHITERCSRPFNEGHFINRCMQIVFSEFCTKKADLF
ncbi:hypothetical protein RF11_07573 [Thelohanellus kitauei]|uniref:Uncharacterized protein n=1 Tax=Thelohanellus kitauei TaxID=669202 RepID=A0A0C2IZQ5_THEKT|nr:hypothetical protein RF11_07573 [Thelohanellus kitauei]